MAFCCDLTCTVVSVHIQANRELQLVELDDPMEYLSNLNRVHLSMILPTQASQITQMDCIKIWSECTFKNILKVNFLKSLILKSNVQITRKYNLHHRTLSPRDKFHLRYLEEVATDEEDGEEEEENEKELELEEKDDVDNGDKEEEGGKEEEADEAQDDEGQPYDELVGLNRPPFCNCNQFTCECSPLDSCDDIFADS